MPLTNVEVWIAKVATKTDKINWDELRESVKLDLNANWPYTFYTGVVEDARRTALQQAELALQNAHSANTERMKGSVFGYETYANLSGGQVAALLDELRELRNKAS
jgi:hypothetical protein